MVGGRKQETGGANAENAEDNAEALAREECERLARQLRIMENDKKAYMEESLSSIKQQEKTIAALQGDIAKMEQELADLSSKHVETKDAEGVLKLTAVLDTYVTLRDKVEKDDAALAELEKQVKRKALKVEKLRLKAEALEKREEMPLNLLEHKEFVLNKKLETVTAKFDLVVAKNAELRSAIDELLKQNVSIMKRYRELESTVKMGRAAVEDLVDQASNAYDQREEAVAKTNALFERNAKDEKQYLLETGELSRTIRHEEKLLDFMNVKNREREFLESEEQRQNRLEYAKEAELEETLESYRHTFEQLLTPESPDFAALVDEYAELQHENISRFNYITELNQDAEKFQREIHNLRQLIKEYAEETVGKNQEKNAAILLKLGRLEGMRKTYHQIQQQMTMYKSCMEEIIGTMSRLLDITDVTDAAPVLELLGGNRQDVSEQNLILYLNILEDRITEILTYAKDNNVDSGRGSPVMMLRSSSGLMNKTPSETSLSAAKPRIVVNERSADAVEDEEVPAYELVQREESPLSYTSMRDKILDTTSLRTGSSLSMVEDMKDKKQ